MTEPIFRAHLAPFEVPLPSGGGFTHMLLDMEYKAHLRDAHEALVRKITADRLFLNEACVANKDSRLFVYEACRRDPEYFIDNFVMTYDDREGSPKPMVLFPFQREKLVRPYVEMVNTTAPRRYTGAMAKSRALGWSWVSMALRVWSWMFKDNWSILIGGEQRDDVDDGGMTATTQSLLGKFRFIVEFLPDWMREDLIGPGWKNDNYNKRMSIRHPLKPLNVVDGKQLGGMFGRGRRYSEVFGDEVAWAEEMEDADTALKQTTNRFFCGSTPRGMVGFFPQMMFGDLQVHRYWCWWAEHPYLGLDWYNEQRQHMTDDQIAQELDIGFERSLGSTVIQNIDVNAFFRAEGSDFDEHLQTQVWIDPGFADHMAAMWVQWDPIREEGRIIDMVVTRRQRIDWIVPFIQGWIPELDSTGKPWPHHYNSVELDIISRHDEWSIASAPVVALGDFAGGAKSANTGTSCWDELEAYGIYVEGVKMPTNEIALEHMNLILRHVTAPARLRDQRNGSKEDCPTLLEVMAQWRYPARRAGTNTQSTKPVHDKYCHPGDCIKMWCWDHPIPSPKNLDVRTKRTVEADPRNRRRRPYRNRWS